MSREYDHVQQKFVPAMRSVDSIAEVIETAASTWPDDRYATYAPTGESYTFAEVNARADDVAAALARAGVKKGDAIGLYLQNSIEYVTAIYACAKLGAVEAPIDWEYQESEIKHAIEVADISTVLAPPDDDIVDMLVQVSDSIDGFEQLVLTKNEPEVGEVAPEDGGDLDVSVLPTLVDGAGDPPTVDQDWEDPVSIIFTSGTTGLPKPTLLSNRSFVLGAKSFRGAPFPQNDVNYNPYPLFHSNHQIFSLLGSAISGTGYVFADSFSASAFADHVRDCDVTSFNIIGGVPKMLDATYEREDVADLPLEVAIGPIPPELKEDFEAKFGVTVINIYGQTESPTLLMNHPNPTERRHGSIGKPMFPDLGHEVAVLDDEGNDVETGEQGELTRTDPAAMLGYYGMPEATRETLCDGRIYSGDLVYRDEDGYVFYVGRKKLMIRRSGENISPQQVEDVIDALNRVEESAVIPVPDEIHGEEVKALVKRNSAEVTEPDIVLEVGRNLAQYKTPRYVEFVESFPRTPSERIKRNDLKEAEQDRDDHGWDREAEFPDWASEL
jgi:acyl-CoA synthetase (AMP-forming)/AMP-acid ligase II